MEYLVALMGVFAVWRVTHMLQDENGPFGVFARLQAWIASRPDKPGSLNDGFYCFYCLSVWVAFPFAFIYAQNVVIFVLVWLSLSAGAIFLNLIHNVLDKYQ